MEATSTSLSKRNEQNMSTLSSIYGKYWFTYISCIIKPLREKRKQIYSVNKFFIFFLFKTLRDLERREVKEILGLCVKKKSGLRFLYELGETQSFPNETFCGFHPSTFKISGLTKILALQD